MVKTIIIYGAGAQGRAARRILESQGFAVSAFADRDEAKVACGAWEGVRLISLNDLRELDKETAIIIGIGAQNLETLRRVDAMLTEWGFRNIFWSAIEFIEYFYPEQKIQPNFYGLELCTNVGCSVQCRWCAQKLFVSRYAERLKRQAPDLPADFMMSFETFKTCLDKVPASVSIDFSGYSETFLNPLAVDMILYAAQKGHKIILYTTLQGLAESDIDRLKNVVFDLIMPHLPDAEGNAKIPVTDDYLKKLIKFWKTFDYAIGCNSNNILANGISYHGVLHQEVFDTLKNNGIDPSKYKNFSENPLPIAGNVGEVRMAQIDNAFPVQCGLTSYCNSRAVNKDDMKFFDEKLQTMPVLFPNGDLTICNHDYGLTMVFGNLLRSDYFDLWKDNNIYNDIIKAQRDPQASVLCRNCEFAFNRNQLKLVTREKYLIEA